MLLSLRWRASDSRRTRSGRWSAGCCSGSASAQPWASPGRACRSSAPRAESPLPPIRAWTGARHPTSTSMFPMRSAMPPSPFWGPPRLAADHFIACRKPLAVRKRLHRSQALSHKIYAAPPRAPCLSNCRETRGTHLIDVARAVSALEKLQNHVCAGTSAAGSAPQCTNVYLHPLAYKHSSKASRLRLTRDDPWQGDFVVLASEPICICGVDVAAPQQLRARNSQHKMSMAELRSIFSRQFTDYEVREGCSAKPPSRKKGCLLPDPPVWRLAAEAVMLSSALQHCLSIAGVPG